MTTLSNNTSWLVDNIRAYIRVGVSGYPANDGYPGFKEFGCILVSGYLDKMTLEEAPVRQVGIPRRDARSRVMYPGSCQEPGTWIQDLAGSWIQDTGASQAGTRDFQAGTGWHKMSDVESPRPFKSMRINENAWETHEHEWKSIEILRNL